jgi:threonine/homoserine/homoserine lactone efflux protein
VPLDSLAALVVFAFVASITPGPANFMLLTSGVNFGFARTIPQLLGISLGFTSLLLAVGFGLGGILLALPSLHAALKMAGGAYILWLAWRIATSRSISSGGGGKARPPRFFDSAMFPWINPKAWVIAVTAMALYTDPNAPFLSVVLISVAFALVNLPSIATWAACGVVLRGLLSDPARLKRFNILMGVLLAATVWPMLS